MFSSSIQLLNKIDANDKDAGFNGAKNKLRKDNLNCATWNVCGILKGTNIRFSFIMEYDEMRKFKLKYC